MNSNVNFIIEDGVLVKAENAIGDIIVPKSVTEIGQYAFSGCENLRSIIIPGSVKYIDRYVFSSCYSLENVTIADGVEWIHSWAFRECYGLRSITIPESVAKFDSVAVFKYCDNLQEIFCSPYLLPNKNLKTMAVMTWLRNPQKLEKAVEKGKVLKYLFSQQINLLPAIFSEDLVGALVYLADNGKISIDEFDDIFLLPAEEAHAAKCAAYLKEWRNKIAGTKTAGEYDKNEEAERDPYNAAAMKLKWSWGKKSDGTICLDFYKGTESIVSVPPRIGGDPVTSIREECFSAQKYQLREDYVTVRKNIQQIILPDRIEEIGDGAFRGCSSLQSIAIPDSVTQIGKFTFAYCSSLQNVLIPKNVSFIGNYAFAGCSNLQSISIPSMVSSIGPGTFFGCGLQEVKIPGGVTSIGTEAFASCKNLRRLVIEPDEIRIVDDAFANCPNLSEIIARLAVLPNTEMKQREVMKLLRNPEKLGKSPIKSEILRYFVSRRKEMLPLIFQEDLVSALIYLADNKKISVNDLEENYLQPAMAANAFQCVSFLLDWKSRNDTPEKAETRLKHELEKDPFNVTDMKKIWTWNWNWNNVENVTLTSYKGTELEINVPQHIGKYIVTSIGEYCFSPYKPRLKAEAVDIRRKITQIRLPDSITAIGHDAFDGCSSLTITAHAGSYAAKYAKKNKIPFIPLEE